MTDIGTVYAWGGDDGQLGDGAPSGDVKPTPTLSGVILPGPLRRLLRRARPQGDDDQRDRRSWCPGRWGDHVAGPT